MDATKIQRIQEMQMFYSQFQPRNGPRVDGVGQPQWGAGFLPTPHPGQYPMAGFDYQNLAAKVIESRSLHTYLIPVCKLVSFHQ